MTVNVKKIGGSVGVVIPKAVAQEMELSEGTALHISGGPDHIVMRKEGRRRRNRRPLSKLLKQISPAAYKRHNRTFSSEPAVGKEIG